MNFNLPLPEVNTGLGFHYFPDQDHYRAKDLQLWLPELKASGASWVTLIGSLARAIPESFLRPLIEAGIEPVIHLPLKPIQAVDLDALEVLYRSYARWGVRYIVLYDQPNTRAAWSANEWGHEGLVGRFLDLLTPPLQIAQANGLLPVFPPLKQVGDYWDTSFLDSALQLLKQRGQTPLLKELVIGFYGFTGNRPPDWGAGGSTRWPESKPYNIPPGSQDQRGFRAFEWYDEVIRARLGESHPMLMLAGGARPGDSDDDNFPAVDLDRHASCNLTIVKAMNAHTLPDYVINVSFWVLAAEGDVAAWRQKDGTPLPALDALRQEAAKAKPVVHSIEAEQAVSLQGKPIYHYLLLPGVEWQDWLAALDYIRKFQPTCGFSAEEARHAAHVTLLGNEQSISAETEHTLRTAGCNVERICGADSAELQARLNELAEAGTRFARV